jgi:hypothetical protein
MKKQFLIIYSKAGANCAEVVTNLFGLQWNPETTRITDHLIQFNMHLKGMDLGEAQKIGFLTNTLPNCAKEIIIDCNTIHECTEALIKRVKIIKDKYVEEKKKNPVLDASIGTAYYALQNASLKDLKTTLSDNLKTMTTTIADSLKNVSKDIHQVTDTIHISKSQRRRSRSKDSLRYNNDFRSPSRDRYSYRNRSFSRDRNRDYYRDNRDSYGSRDYRRGNYQDRNRSFSRDRYYNRNGSRDRSMNRYRNRSRDYYRNRSDSRGNYSDRKRSRDRSNDSRSSNNGSSDKRSCFDCGKFGHIKRNCRASNTEKADYQRSRYRNGNRSSNTERNYHLRELMDGKPQKSSSCEKLYKMFEQLQLESTN